MPQDLLGDKKVMYFNISYGTLPVFKYYNQIAQAYDWARPS